MEERPISSRMQELLQRAADERQAEQNRQGETVESLRERFDELSDSVVTGNERLKERIDATFALTASTVDILQRLADRVDALERSLDDITMRLGSISWRMDEVRDGERRLAERIDESALALAEAMFASGHRRRPDIGRRDVDGEGSDRSGIGLAVADPEAQLLSTGRTDDEFSVEPEDRDVDEARHDRVGEADEADERHLPSFAAAAARFQAPPPSEEPVASPAAEPEAHSNEPDGAGSSQPTEPMQPQRPEHDDRPYANVVDLPSSTRESADPQLPGEDVAGGRPAWGPSGDFLGSRPAAVAATSPSTAAFEFPAETLESTAPSSDDEQQDFFDRWGPRRYDTAVAEPAADVPPPESPRDPENTAIVRGMGGPRTGARFLREVSAARENQEPPPTVEAVPGTDAQASDDTVPPEWFASYFRNDARSSGAQPAARNTPSDRGPLPGSRPAPGSA